MWNKSRYSYFFKIIEIPIRYCKSIRNNTATIEIEPSDYELNNYERPNGTIEEKRDEWSELWFKCVSDSGLNNIKPIESGSWFVDLSQLTKNDLEIIIKRHIKEVNLSNFKEEMVALSGGIVIQNNNEILIEPTCCGDISDIQNWEEIRNTELNKWTQLWIGHPWVFYKKNDNYITISDYTDNNLEDFKDISENINFQNKNFCLKSNQVGIVKSTLKTE